MKSHLKRIPETVVYGNVHQGHPAVVGCPWSTQLPCLLKWNFSTSFSNRFILNLLDTSKVLGVDNLPDRILRACVKELSIPLTHLFNSSLRSDVMPTLWRFANINLVYKGGNRDVVDNYRSMSLQPLLLSTWSV